jgi:hypothetical protein
MAWSKPREDHTIAHSRHIDSLSACLDDPAPFVAQHDRPWSSPLPVDNVEVRMAHSRREETNEDLATPRRVEEEFLVMQGLARTLEDQALRRDCHGLVTCTSLMPVSREIHDCVVDRNGTISPTNPLVGRVEEERNHGCGNDGGPGCQRGNSGHRGQVD